MRVVRNQQALKDMPKLAERQLVDAQRGRTNTREQITRVHQQEAQAMGRQNAALPADSWEAMDSAVYQATKDSMTIVQDLLNAGLRYSVDLRAEYDTWGIIDDTGTASVGMTPEAQEEESDVTTGDDGSPIPIIDDGYSIGFREEPLTSDRLPTDGLDTTKATVAGRHVSEAIEEMFIDADNFTISGVGGEGYTLHGMTDHPDIANGDTTADWTTDSTAIRDDFRGMRGVLKNDRNYSPGGTGFWTYLGTEYYDTLDDADPEGDGNQTVRDRVENLANISRIAEAEFLPEKSAMMFRPTEDVIQVGVGADMSTVQWEDPFRDRWRALASMYPRIKRTHSVPGVSGDYQTGIVYWTAP